MMNAEEEELLLQQARLEFSPTEDQAARVRQGVVGSVALLGSAELARSLAEGTAGLALGSGGTAGAVGKFLGALSGKSWLAGAVLAAGVSTGAGVVLLQEASDGDRRTAAAEQGVPEAPGVVDSEPPRERKGDPARASEPFEAVKSLEEAQDTQTRVDVPEVAPASRVQGQRLSLEQELASVRSAEAALDSGNPAATLALLDRTPPSSGAHLAEERAALRVLAHCQLGSPTSADRARSFLRKHPSSLYAGRIRRACGE